MTPVVEGKKKDWISAREAAMLLSANSGYPISTDYVRVLVRKRNLPIRKVAPRYYEYPRSSFEHYQVKPKKKAVTTPVT